MAEGLWHFAVDDIYYRISMYGTVLIVTCALICGKDWRLGVRTIVLGITGIAALSLVFGLVVVVGIPNGWIEFPKSVGSPATAHLWELRDYLLALWGYCIIAWAFVNRFCLNGSSRNSIQRIQRAVLRSVRPVFVVGAALAFLTVSLGLLDVVSDGGNVAGQLVYHLDTFLGGKFDSSLPIAAVLGMAWAISSIARKDSGSSEFHSKVVNSMLAGSLLSLSLGATALDYRNLSMELSIYMRALLIWS